MKERFILEQALKSLEITKENLEKIRDDPAAFERYITLLNSFSSPGFKSAVIGLGELGIDASTIIGVLFATIGVYRKKFPELFASLEKKPTKLLS